MSKIINKKGLDIMKDLKNIIIMKCGTHASEKIEDIYNRKKQEEEKVGYFY